VTDDRELRRVVLLPWQIHYLAKFTGRTAVEVKQDGSELFIFDGSDRVSIDARSVIHQDLQTENQPVLTKTITYKDLNEQPQTETFYFHLSKADVIDIIANNEHVEWERIATSGDEQKSFELVKQMLRRTYGVKSEDGKRFIRSNEVWENFVESEAYSALVFELATDAEASAAFFNGVLPQGLLEEVSRIAAQREHPGAILSEADRSVSQLPPEQPVAQQIKSGPAGEEAVPVPKEAVERQVLTPAEIEAMDAEEFRSGIATGRFIVGQ
jgi:hypothetical protein